MVADLRTARAKVEAPRVTVFIFPFGLQKKYRPPALFHKHKITLWRWSRFVKVLPTYNQKPLIFLPAWRLQLYLTRG
jgi:hypothetical protein